MLLVGDHHAYICFWRLLLIVVQNGVLKAISISKITGSFQRIEGRIEGSRVDIEEGIE